MVGETKPNHPQPRRRVSFSQRQLLMQAVVAGVILVSGIGIGTGGTILALKDRIVWDIASPPPDRPPGPRPEGDIVGYLRGKYALTNEQAQQVRVLFAKRLEAARERRKQVEADEQAEREKLIEDMKPILNPDQFARWSTDYRKMMEDMRNRPFWGPRGDRRGPPRGDRRSDRPRDSNDRRWDGPPRPMMDGDGHRGGWPPRSPGDPNGRHRPDRFPSPNRPTELQDRPAEVNGPR
jgi:hypothetical protein